MGKMGLWVPRERKLALVRERGVSSPGFGPPAAMPLVSFMALGTVCPTWGGSFLGRLGSSDLGGEEGLGPGSGLGPPSSTGSPGFLV